MSEKQIYLTQAQLSLYFLDETSMSLPSGRNSPRRQIKPYLPVEKEKTNEDEKQNVNLQKQNIRTNEDDDRLTTDVRLQKLNRSELKIKTEYYETTLEQQRLTIQQLKEQNENKKNRIQTLETSNQDYQVENGVLKEKIKILESTNQQLNQHIDNLIQKQRNLIVENQQQHDQILASNSKLYNMESGQKLENSRSKLEQSLKAQQTQNFGVSRIQSQMIRHTSGDSLRYVQNVSRPANLEPFKFKSHFSETNSPAFNPVPNKQMHSQPPLFTSKHSSFQNDTSSLHHPHTQQIPNNGSNVYLLYNKSNKTNNDNVVHRDISISLLTQSHFNKSSPIINPTLRNFVQKNISQQ